MVPPITDPLVFDFAGDDNRYKVHKCGDSDGNPRCSFGVTSLSTGDHSNYFGKRVSEFGKQGCPNPECAGEAAALEQRIAATQGEISALEQQIRSTPVQADKVPL